MAANSECCFVLFCPEVPTGHFQKLFPALYMFKLELKQYLIPFFAVVITDSTNISQNI